MSHLKTLHAQFAVPQMDLSTFNHLSQMTSREIQDVIDKTQAQFPYQGTTDADPTYVLPQCRKGASLAQLQHLCENSNERVAKQLRDVVADQKTYARSFREIY